MSDEELEERIASLRRENDTQPDDDGPAIDYMIENDGSTPRAEIDAQLAEWGYAPASISEMWAGVDEGYADAAEQAAAKSHGDELSADARAAFRNGPPVVVRVYPGRTQSDAAHLFQRDAGHAAAYGYSPTGQSWSEGRPGIGRVVMLGFYSMVFKPKGYLTVTYAKAVTRGAVVADPGTAGTKTCPMCAEEVKAAAKICRFCRYEFEASASNHTA